MAKATHVQLDEKAIEAIDAAFNANPEESANHVLKQEALRRCLNDLPNKSRLIFDLKYQDRMPLQQIAKSTGDSLTGVTKSLSRLRHRLAQCIQKRLLASGEA